MTNRSTDPTRPAPGEGSARPPAAPAHADDPAARAAHPLGLTAPQAGALERFARLKVGAAFLEQGMGKSRLAVELANSRARQLDAVLWVAPYSVLATVEEEVEKWDCRVPVRFLGYQTLSQSDRTYLDVLQWAKERRLMVIADESTFIKNRTSKRHERLTEIRKSADYALVLTGTPLTRDLWDLKRQLDWLSPKIINTDDRAYRYRYFTMHKQVDGDGGERVWFETYPPNVAHLRSLMEPYIFEARLNIGVPETAREYEYGVTQETQTAYEEERDDFLAAWAEWGEEMALYRMLGNLKKISALDPGKCAAVAESVAGQHTIVFCQYLEEQQQIAGHLKHHLLINGATPEAERREIFRRSRSESIPLLLTYGTGSFGLNLQHMSTCHFSSLPYDYGQVEQARSRIRRLGQTRELTYVTHLADLGIDRLIAKNLRKKDWLARLLRREIDPTTTL
ncbi:DEAD/DEAH box helicase [Streptomyces sp. B29(2018)]|uniref:helicase-related protein n=1 Tax=Streptomyces sp. B29(2018) TaxID=2485016 RepID=UPI000FD63384|nr:DEAD/DEAH box helicase [Streptomyces sp. B29(2018)]